MIEKIETESQGFYTEMKTIKMLFDNQPPATDLELCDLWMREMHGHYARVGAGIEPRAKALFAQATVDVVTNCPEEQYKRFKSSTTLTEAMVSASYPHTAKVVFACKSLLKLMEIASDDYRTLISAVKQEKGMAPRNAV